MPCIPPSAVRLLASSATRGADPWLVRLTGASDERASLARRAASIERAIGADDCRCVIWWGADEAAPLDAAERSLLARAHATFRDLSCEDARAMLARPAKGRGGSGCSARVLVADVPASGLPKGDAWAALEGGAAELSKGDAFCVFGANVSEGPTCCSPVTGAAFELARSRGLSRVAAVIAPLAADRRELARAVRDGAVPFADERTEGERARKAVEGAEFWVDRERSAGGVRALLAGAATHGRMPALARDGVAASVAAALARLRDWRDAAIIAAACEDPRVTAALSCLMPPAARGEQRLDVRDASGRVVATLSADLVPDRWHGHVDNTVTLERPGFPGVIATLWIDGRDASHGAGPGPLSPLASALEGPARHAFDLADADFGWAAAALRAACAERALAELGSMGMLAGSAAA